MFNQNLHNILLRVIRRIFLSKTTLGFGILDRSFYPKFRMCCVVSEKIGLRSCVKLITALKFIGPKCKVSTRAESSPSYLRKNRRFDFPFHAMRCWKINPLKSTKRERSFSDNWSFRETGICGSTNPWWVFNMGPCRCLLVECYV